MAEKHKFTIRIQKAPEGGYTGQCLELPGAISEGETIEELKKNMSFCSCERLISFLHA
ncbi:MAG: type II toxin-antitoxin system HicB family antitoxin [Thaumarchaeota archaeon]|nr:type II toxin-antitoxin system HicB family antitoxin [Nitrososphaerota archaeon]